MKALEIQSFVSNDHIVNEVAVSDKGGRIAARNSIERFQFAVQAAVGSERGEMQEINNNGLKEHFVNGAYIRELFIPKDKCIVSKIWTVERMWIIATGEVTFSTEMGVQRVKAPYTKIVPPGSKVALITHEDTLWFAITGAEATNSDDVEKEVSTMNYGDCVYPWDELEENKS